MRYVRVVKVLKGVHSAFDHGTYTLEYVQGRWTYPRIGKIYAFQDYEHARRWASDYDGVTIWEAEAEVAKNGTCMMCSEENKYLGIFWKWDSLFLTGKAHHGTFGNLLVGPVSRHAARRNGDRRICL